MVAVHSFEIEDAEKYGMLEAVLLYNIKFWVKKNEANGYNFYDGRYWTHNSSTAFAKLFPYASKEKIKRALKHLTDIGVLISGRYGDDPWDRTYWYAVADLDSSDKECHDENENSHDARGNSAPCDGTYSHDARSNSAPSYNNNNINKGFETDINTNINTDNTSCADPSTMRHAPEDKVVISLTLNDKTEYEVKESYVKTMQELYPAVNVMNEMRSMKAWCINNPQKRKTRSGIKRFINSWLAKEQNGGGGTNLDQRQSVINRWIASQEG